MTVGAEVDIVYDWISTTLANSPAVTGYVGNRVYADLAPATAQYPYIVYQLLQTTDVQLVNAQRVLVDGEYIVRAVAKANTYSFLRPIAAAIDTALEGVTGSVTNGGYVVASQRTRQYAQVEEHEGGTIRNLGGVYRMLAQGA